MPRTRHSRWTLPSIVASIGLAIALALFLLSCDSQDGDIPLNLGAQVQLIESSGQVVVEDVSIDRRAILIRVAPEFSRDQCGRLLIVNFDGQIEVLADDVYMPFGGVTFNFAAFSPSGEEVAYVSNGCQLGPLSLRILSSGDGEPETLAGSVSVIRSWAEETKIIFGRVGAGDNSVWEANPRTGDVAELTSDPVLAVSPDGSTFVFLEDSTGILNTGEMTSSFEGIPTGTDTDGSAFSPDGSEYVYLALLRSDQGFELAVVDLDSGTQKTILPAAELNALLSTFVVEWVPNGRSVLVQGGGDSTAYVIDTDSLEQTRLSLGIPASSMFWQGPLLVYGGGGDIWATILDYSGERETDVRALSEQIRAGFPVPVDIGPD